jgi:lambda family phage portal protein
MVQTYTDPEIDALIGPTKIQAMGGAYDAAGRFDRQLALWSPPIQSADGDILPEKGLMDARVRDMRRNDAYVQSGEQLHKDGIVGAMYLLNAKPELRVLGTDEKWAEEFQAEVEAKFSLWAESPNNWPDAARINTLTAMIRLAVGVYVSTGEVLATAEWLREDTIAPYRTAIQMVDLDRLSNPWNRMSDDYLRGGVEYNKYGAPVAYHIRTGHPSDPMGLGSQGWDWKRVAVRKPWGRLQVIHILEQTRVDQSRGVSEMVAALKEMKITKRFRDVTLQNAVVNATYAASIESELPSETVFQQIGGGNIGEQITDYSAAYLGAVAEYIGDSKHMHLDGVKIPHLFPGTKLQLRPAGKPGGVGDSFEASLLRYIAANLGVSYEQLSRDYSGSNYSSIRAAIAETGRFMASRKRMVADRFASSVYRLWFEEATNTGQLETMKGKPSIYEGMNLDAYTACDWIGASKGQIDELKETQAAVLRLKYGLSTREDELMRLGKDWRKVFVQLEREAKEMKKRGIETPEQAEANMMNATTGAPREKQASEDEGDSTTSN